MKYTISDLQQMYRRYRMQVLLLLLILIAALVLVFQSRLLTLAALALALLFHLCVVRCQQKKYIHAFTCSNLEHTLCPKLGITTVSEKGAASITPDLLQKADLMPFRQTLATPLLRWELSGQMRGLSVSLCDAVLAQDFKLVEKGKQRVHMNTGIWTHIELSKDTGLVYNTFREDMKQALPVEELRSACAETYGGAGNFTQIDSTMVSGQEIEEEDYAVVMVKAQYEKQIVTFQVGYDADMQVVGLYMK